MPQPQSVHKSPAVKHAVQSVPVAQPATPNQIVKHRWLDRFKKHPRWFH